MDNSIPSPDTVDAEEKIHYATTLVSLFSLSSEQGRELTDTTMILFKDYSFREFKGFMFLFAMNYRTQNMIVAAQELMEERMQHLTPGSGKMKLLEDETITLNTALRVAIIDAKRIDYSNPTIINAAMSIIKHDAKKSKEHVFAILYKKDGSGKTKSGLTGHDIRKVAGRLCSEVKRTFREAIGESLYAAEKQCSFTPFVEKCARKFLNKAPNEPLCLLLMVHRSFARKEGKSYFQAGVNAQSQGDSDLQPYSLNKETTSEDPSVELSKHNIETFKCDAQHDRDYFKGFAEWIEKSKTVQGWNEDFSNEPGIRFIAKCVNEELTHYPDDPLKFISEKYKPLPKNSSSRIATLFSNTGNTTPRGLMQPSPVARRQEEVWATQLDSARPVSSFQNQFSNAFTLPPSTPTSTPDKDDTDIYYADRRMGITPDHYSSWRDQPGFSGAAPPSASGISRRAVDSHYSLHTRL